MSMDWTPHVVIAHARQEIEESPLLVLLHGFGADEADLLPVATHLPPQFEIASIRVPFEQGPGRAWFPLQQEAAFDFATVEAVVDRLADWLQERREHHDKIVLLGFSQGMAVATSLLRRRPELVDAIVGCSGFAFDVALDTRRFFDDDGAGRRRVPMFWGRDPQDPVIDEEKVEYTNAWARSNTKLMKVNYAGIGHGIGAQEISHIGEFLDAEVLGARI